MNDRILAWLSAGALATGVCAGMIAGAGVALADDDAGANAATSSSTASSDDETKSVTTSSGAPPGPDEQTDTTKAGEESHIPDDDEPVDQLDDVADEVGEPDDDEDVGTEDEAPEDEARENEAADDEDETSSKGEAVSADEPESTPEVSDLAPAPEPADETAAVVNDETPVPKHRAVPADSLAQEHDTEMKGSTAERLITSDPQPATDVASLAMTVADEQPAAKPSLLTVVGSFVWGMFDLVTKMVDVPPTVPPGSTLTAGRSKLEIDCGDGYIADADWYFPTEGEPEKFIYFQHGFPARAGFYNVTLQQLAERNDAIVVAPSITSNIFACDACAASGEPMHAAVARLFEGDRAALLASARGAGFEGALPEQFVFTGQSAGASLAIAAAGYYYESAPADEKSDMVGVLLYEVSATGGAATGNALTNGLRKLPASVPVLDIAAEPSTINTFNNAIRVFAEERPGQFNGVRLVGGAHSDAFQSDMLFGIPQFLVNVLFGASTPENVEAVQVLTSGWLVDMYAGRVYDPTTRTGIYAEPGEPGEVVVDIPTGGTFARGAVLPVPTPELSPFDRLVDGFFSLLNANYYASCVVKSTESASAQSDFTFPI